MQIGISQLVVGAISLVLIVIGAFSAGTKWNAEPRTQTASAEASHEEDASIEVPVEHEESGESATLYRVVKVIDGDTVTIERDGAQETIRLIGIDTPETNDTRTGVQCFGKEATTKLKSVIGDQVSIETDASQGERDKYKRLLAYIYNEEGTMLNKYLIAQGYAYEYTYDEPYKYVKEFKAAEADAKKNKRGLWAPNACPEPVKPKTSAAPKQAAAAAATQPAVTESSPPPTTTPAQLMAQPESAPESKADPKPAPAPKPEPAPEPAETQTSGSYTCSTNKYNCKDFKTQAEAQAVFEQCGGLENDVHRLDSNKDGEVCESLP